MSNKKHNQFMKTYKMAVYFKLNHADFPPFLNSTVSKLVSFVSDSLSCTNASRSFSNKVRSISFKSLTKSSSKPFPRVNCFCSKNVAPKHLHNLFRLLVFDLACNVPAKLKHYVICESFTSLESVAVNVNFAPVFVCQRVNVVRLVFCHPHVSFLVKPLFTTINFVCPVTVIMLSLSIFAECFHPCIVVQVSSGSFPIGNMRMLQAFLYHPQIYFLLLVLNLIFHH